MQVEAFPPEQVTTKSEREVDPRSVGMTRRDVEGIWAAVVRFYRSGVHPAIGLCIRRRGKIVLDRTIGHARGNAPRDSANAERVLATPDTLFSLFSGSKVVTAILVHILADRNKLHLGQSVAAFVPEFGTKGKQRITVRDLLSHQAGIPDAPRDILDLDLLADKARILRRICELEPRFAPGSVPAYHALTSGFLLAELIERVSGMTLREFLAQEIAEPLEMRSFNYGVHEDDIDRVAMNAFTGPPPRWPMKQILGKALGFGMPELVEMINDRRFQTGVVPSANVTGTQEEICRFFEMLRTGGLYRGHRVISAAALQRAVQPQSPGRFDRVIKIPMAYSMGFMLGHPLYGFYGPRCGSAFGHIGMMNIAGWADPERDIAVALLNTGKPMPSIETLWWSDLLTQISFRIPRDGTATRGSTFAE